MDFNLGHGFIPRIGQENYKAVDRCVGPADLFNPDPLDLPWAVVDGAWAEGRPELLGTLRSHGTKLLVDTHGVEVPIRRGSAGGQAPWCELGTRHPSLPDASFCEDFMRAPDHALLGQHEYQ